MMYSENLAQIKDTLLKILDELVKVSQQIPRPENSFRKSDKQFLMEVTFDDKKYKDSVAYLAPKLEALIQPFRNLLTDLGPFEKYLQLNSATFLRTNPNVKGVKDELVKLDQMSEHMDTMPFFCCARLMEIDFRQLKMELEGRLENYKDSIIKWAHKNIRESASELDRAISATFDYIKVKPQTTEKLIDIEQYIAKIRKQTEKKFRNDFEEMKKWIFYLYSLDFRFTKEQYAEIYKAASLLFSLPQKVSEEENRIEEEKLRLEELTANLRNQLHNDINILIADIQSLKSFNDQFDQVQANEKIDQLQEKIRELNAMMNKINKDEELLQLSSISEFPKLE